MALCSLWSNLTNFASFEGLPDQSSTGLHNTFPPEDPVTSFVPFLPLLMADNHLLENAQKGPLTVLNETTSSAEGHHENPQRSGYCRLLCTKADKPKEVRDWDPQGNPRESGLVLWENTLL